VAQEQAALDALDLAALLEQLGVITGCGPEVDLAAAGYRDPGA
jgi:hypothetical protein